MKVVVMAASSAGKRVPYWVDLWAGWWVVEMVVMLVVRMVGSMAVMLAGETVEQKGIQRVADLVVRKVAYLGASTVVLFRHDTIGNVMRGLGREK